MLAKAKVNTIKVLLSINFIDSYIDHDEFILINNVLKEFEYMKEAKSYPKTFCSDNEYALYTPTH